MQLFDLTPVFRVQRMLCQAGPFAARCHAHAGRRVLFRVLELRRLRLAHPFAPRRCSRRPRSNRSVATALHVPPRVPGVARNIRIADMNVDVPVADAQRIEVVANGLSVWRMSQLAFDATIVSRLTRLGEAHARADVEPGCVVSSAP